MFSFQMTQTSRMKYWKKPWIVARQLTRVYACSTQQNQAYKFSTNYILSDFLDIQKQSFQTFLTEGLIQELKHQTVSVPFRDKNDKNLQLKLFFYPELYRLLEPKLTVKQAMFKSSFCCIFIISSMTPDHYCCLCV